MFDYVFDIWNPFLDPSTLNLSEEERIVWESLDEIWEG